MDTKFEITVNEIETELSHILARPCKGVCKDEDGKMKASVSFQGLLTHNQLEALMELGAISIKRSGPGLTIQLVTEK